MQGYFLVADILGFSDIIKDNNSNNQNPIIEKWVILVNKLTEEHGIKKFQLISDSLLVGIGSENEDLDNLVSFSRKLLEEGLNNKFPIRGAISYGEYEWGSLTYGKAVIEAFEFEKQQNWIGISINSLPVYKGQYNNLALYPVPKKSGFYGLYYAVIWEVPEFPSLLEKSNNLEKGKFFQHTQLDKLTNTILYRNYLKLISLENKPLTKFYGTHPLEKIETFIETLMPE
ncbi:MAG: hypothetical protein COV35_00075 [Alphaproteobacteria bacterium CG11_big_fil_rev_8_21_14_0_20_39_49]|nr:MAG: hypothetical protein COV35_00075 [Alphaproteobacteria bacterium CG11_big_fil_rev_8_21_14_0_20_39_49]